VVVLVVEDLVVDVAEVSRNFPSDYEMLGD
jgi:hypothetical protein